MENNHFKLVEAGHEIISGIFLGALNKIVNDLIKYF
jgi:hypothetical protein